MKFILTAIETDIMGRHTSTHTLEFQRDALPEIIPLIQQFLLGSGFYLKNLDYEN